MVHDAEAIADFVIEGWELLDCLDRNLLEAEADPARAPVDSIFRVMHTFKGGAGFVNLEGLEQLAHQAESLLDQVREGERVLDRALVQLLFSAADCLRSTLVQVERGDYSSSPLLVSVSQQLCLACQGAIEPEAPPAAVLAAAEVSEPELSWGLPALEEETPAQADNLVRVRVDLLDKLMNLVGELVLCRNQLLQLSTRVNDDSLNSGAQRLNLVTSELQEHVTRTRMQPISTVLARFPRVVRELARANGKDVRLMLEGQETGLDRTVLEAIKDPLLHIVRNALDHGLEATADRLAAGKNGRGTVLIRAYHEGGQVTIEISDDGRGIDLEKLRDRALQRGLYTPVELDKMSERDLMRVVFQPGFSTADSVTHLSGRGVGMDVVKSSIERIGGTVDLCSRAGQGLTVKLRIPLTLAIIPALVVRVDEHRYAIPQINLQELVHLHPERVESVHGTPVYRLRGELLPLLSLRQLLGLPGQAESENIVVVQAEGRPFGLVVDCECDTEEIVVKPLTRELKKLQLYAGATIMGDGRVALILDIGGLARSAGLAIDDFQALEREGEEARAAELKTQSWLLFRLHGQELYAVPLGLVARLEEFPAAQVETTAGRRVVQYRGRLLPLSCLAETLGQPRLDSSVLRVLVFSHEDRDLGLVVGEILDVVEHACQLSGDSPGFGLLGATIIQGQAATILDMRAVLEAVCPDWLKHVPSVPVQEGGRRLLLADDSDFFRVLTRTYLETQGYEVVEAPDTGAALQRLQQDSVRAVLVDLAMEGAAEMLQALAATPQDRPCKLLALTTRRNGPPPQIPGVEFLTDLCAQQLNRMLQ